MDIHPDDKIVETEIAAFGGGQDRSARPTAVRHFRAAVLRDDTPPTAEPRPKTPAPSAEAVVPGSTTRYKMG